MPVNEPVTQSRKRRLAQYIYIRGEYEDLMEELVRLENDQYIPGAKGEAGEEKKQNGASDRMANAVMRRLAFIDSVADEIEAKAEEMAAIEKATAALSDGLERRVIRLRYITGSSEGRRHMPWTEVAARVYGCDSDAQLKAVFRIHGRALQNIDL